MKANELRIGNWVQCQDDLDGEPDYVHHLDFKDVDRCRINYIGEGNYLGIPLTEERLKRFWFEQGSHPTMFYHPEYPWFELEKTDKGFALTVNAFYVITLEQVHELQNAFKPLTGEELTIK